MVFTTSHIQSQHFTLTSFKLNGSLFHGFKSKLHLPVQQTLKTQMYSHKNVIGLFVGDEKELIQLPLKKGTFLLFFLTFISNCCGPGSFSFIQLGEGLLSQITQGSLWSKISGFIAIVFPQGNLQILNMRSKGRK